MRITSEKGPKTNSCAFRRYSVLGVLRYCLPRVGSRLGLVLASTPFQTALRNTSMLNVLITIDFDVL